jgi:hypothetical protein
MKLALRYIGLSFLRAFVGALVTLSLVLPQFAAHADLSSAKTLGLSALVAFVTALNRAIQHYFPSPDEEAVAGGK